MLLKSTLKIIYLAAGLAAAIETNKLSESKYTSSEQMDNTNLLGIKKFEVETIYNDIDDSSSKTDDLDDWSPTPNIIQSHCKSHVFEIKTVGDLDKLEECSTISGDIIITNYKSPILSLDAKRIEGNLVIKSSSDLVRIEAPKLETITKSFSLNGLTSLSLISAPKLKSISELSWKVLPILSNAQLGDQIKDLESITVADTSLTGFSGFQGNKLRTLDINNNRFLNSINFSVESVTEKLHIAGNSPDIKVDLSKLKSANNVTIHEVFEINISQLEEIDHSINLIKNFFTAIKLQKLKSIGGTLILMNNEKLSNIAFPEVTEIGGGLIIVNNTGVEKIDFLPKLKVIGGALELVGNIKETNFDQLKLVKGSAKLKTHVSSFDCNKWSKSEMGKVVRGGQIECVNYSRGKSFSDKPSKDNSTGRSKIKTESSGASVCGPRAVIPLLIVSILACAVYGF